MSNFFKAKKKAEDLKQGGGNYITQSGIYPVNVIAPFVNISAKGSTTVDFYINHKDKKQVMYGNLRITNNNDSDGNEVTNEIGTKVFNQFVIIAELKDVSGPIEATLPIGPKEASKDVAVLEDLADIDVLMQVQIEYSKYNGSFKEKKIIKGFFRAEDKATAEEIVNDSGFGEGYAKSEKYFNNITYNDVTKEEIQEWIDAKRPEGTAGDSASGASKPKADFGKKRSFGKK